MSYTKLEISSWKFTLALQRIAMETRSRVSSYTRCRFKCATVGGTSIYWICSLSRDLSISFWRMKSRRGTRQSLRQLVVMHQPKNQEGTWDSTSYQPTRAWNRPASCHTSWDSTTAFDWRGRAPLAARVRQNLDNIHIFHVTLSPEQQNQMVVNATFTLGLEWYWSWFYWYQWEFSSGFMIYVSRVILGL